jgi:hypothetical protein
MTPSASRSIVRLRAGIVPMRAGKLSRISRIISKLGLFGALASLVFGVLVATGGLAAGIAHFVSDLHLLQAAPAPHALDNDELAELSSEEVESSDEEEAAAVEEDAIVAAVSHVLPAPHDRAQLVLVAQSRGPTADAEPETPPPRS